MRFQSFLRGIKKQRRMVEKRKKRKGDEFSNQARKKIRVSQIQVPSSSPSSLSPSSPPSSLSPSSPTSSLSPLTSLSLSSAPSSSSQNWTHDVFPSFRGEDVRRNFLSHVQKEFKIKGITPFIDNEINRGESIGPELIRAIRGSKIAIVLLSKKYASSKWCLDELVEIMNCKEELGQTVIPVFYEVDPSDVKKLRGHFGKVFEKTCEGKSKEDIEKWRHALEEVATIAGYDSRTWDNEAAMIEEIANVVLNTLFNSVPSSDFDTLVGMRAHMEKIEPLLCLESGEVRMIGIWGPSGIGKSTIARFLFDKHSHGFQLIVYMEDIKRHYPRPCFNIHNAQLQLQKEFLSLIINQDDVTVRHLGVVQDMLKNKKVLVVLDDVDQSAQLDALAKELWWFGQGSRIIITTQDKKILNAHRIDHIYEVDFPEDDEALEIFCISAFGQKSPDDGFQDLARELTYLAGKLPLGLRVMGSYFKGMSKEEWIEDLPRLRTRLDGEIESILRFSYDALCDEEQAIFLHIACFFKGRKIDEVEEFLAEKFVSVKSHLRVLAQKSLIYFVLGYIKMHNLLERLGREIVRKQSPNEPGQRQFLVDGGDICQVLRDDTLGSRSVIGINFEKGKELKVSDGAFERMSNVQFLRLCYDYDNPSSYKQESLKCLPREVKLLHLEHFPMICLPSNFNPEFLVEISLSFSKLEKLWEGNKDIRNLKWMDLNDSINLKKLPDLSTATNLLKLNLRHCSSLMELPFSLGNMTNLKKLDLSSCSNLVELPFSIGNMTNLKNLDMAMCSKLVKLPSSFGNMTNMFSLFLDKCSSLVELPSSIGNMTNLTEFSLMECSKIVELPSSIGNMTNLKELSLSGSSNLVELPSSIGNVNLKKLDLMNCSSLVEIPSSIGNMYDLKDLYLSGCSSLMELPSSIGNLHNLWRLYMQGCSKLKTLPLNINMKSLDELNLTDCSSLRSFPEISTNIKFLRLNGTAIEEIPPSIRSWSRLDILSMPYSENLKKSQHAFDLITELQLSDAELQEISPWVKEMSHLQRLEIKECMKLVSLPELPDSLKIINANGCESLERLDCSFYKTQFYELSFVNCFKLNQEARDLIVKTTSKDWTLFPGERVPAYFTCRATGSSLSMKLNGLDTNFPKPVRFKACILLVYNGDTEADLWYFPKISHSIKYKLRGVSVLQHSGDFLIRRKNSPRSEHLVVSEFEITVSSPELGFEFRISELKWEIKECGIRPLQSDCESHECGSSESDC